MHKAPAGTTYQWCISFLGTVHRKLGHYRLFLLLYVATTEVLTFLACATNFSLRFPENGIKRKLRFIEERMARKSSKAAGIGAVAGILVLMASLSLAESLEYPVARKMEQVDSYHGVKVSDPYRWLEDDRSEETGRWVKAENEVTFSYLDKIPYRAQVMKRLEQLYNYPKYVQPFRRGSLYFFSK